MATDSLEIHFTLNGRARVATVPRRAPALALLRDQLGCSSLKAGCSPQGVCGSCAAVIGGKPRLTCTLPAKALDGKDILTHDGLDPVQALIIGQAFAAAGLAQAGYEIPGMVMSLVALRGVADGQPLDASMVRKALQLHVSRSFGYDAVIAAFLLADRALRGEVKLPVVPQTLVRAALGTRASLDDLRRPGMLHGALVFAPAARCVIDGLDLGEATAIDGVYTVITAEHLPAARHYGVCVADCPVLVNVGERTRGCADIVAVVLASTRAVAQQGALAVKVAVTIEEPELDVNNAAEQLGRVIHRVKIQRGNAKEALGLAAHRARLRTQTRGGDPLFVEPEAALAVPVDGGSVRVYSAGQDLFRDLEQLAAITGLDPDDILLEHLPVGGAFGGRMDLGVTGLALLAALATDRPVKLALSLAEGARIHSGRHPNSTQIELGCDEQGRLKALRATVLLDTGGYTGAGPIVADTIARHAAMAYDIEHVDLDVLCIRSDNPPAGLGLGLGLPAYNLAVEGVLDRLADDVGLDPISIRSRNLLAPGDVTASGVTVPASWNPGPTLAALTDELSRLRQAGNTVGVALGVQIQGVAGDAATAELVVLSPGHVQIFTGFSESGQGFDTRAMVRSAQITGLPLDIFEVRTSTRCDVPCGPTMAGRDRRLGLPAVTLAAQGLAAALSQPGASLGSLVGQHFVGEAEAGTVIGFTAQAAAIAGDGGLAELVVALNTGDAEDSPQTLGWLAAAAQQGLEQALTAERIAVDGLPETRWTKLGVLKARHVPPITLRAMAGGPAVPLEDTIVTATPAAVASALRAAGQPQTVLPAKGSTVARKMGIRPPRK